MCAYIFFITVDMFIKYRCFFFFFVYAYIYKIVDDPKKKMSN